MTKEEVQREIGQMLADFRREKGLSQREISEMTGLTRNHIARIEVGRYNVGYYHIYVIAKALGKKIKFVKFAK